MEFHEVLVKFKCESLYGLRNWHFSSMILFYRQSAGIREEQAKLLCVNWCKPRAGLVCLFHHWVLMAQHHAWYDKCWQYLSNTYA